MKRLNTSKTAIAVALAALALTARAHAFDSFTIKEIRAEGLQRLEIGTVLTYMPLSAGDELNNNTAKQAVRALYSSGLFQDVQLQHDGNVLIIKVQERPAISTFKLEGNDKVGGEELKKSLKNMGLADGELFRRDLLDTVEQELRRQYYANGYYDVTIDSKVTEEPNNRVAINVKVREGMSTKISNINIVGNKAFSSEDLIKRFNLQETNWMPFQKNDRYSKQALSGDLEKLQSFYQDRGYLKFSVDSVQVQLTPDKKSIYITINITEGDVYRVKARRFSGETILNDRYLEALASTDAGSIFSRKQATETSDRIESILSDIGYAFAKVTPIPELDEDKREVTINYMVDPGKRAYVRHIVFTGNNGTNDETLRREMRQLEAAPYSKTTVERSRVRLSRLPFIEDAQVDTKPVPGTDDQVDVSFKVKERPPGSVQFGVGYSGSYGFLINGQVTHTNFLGTGNRLDLSAENNAVSKSINLSWSDPYFTEDGISQTSSIFYRKSKAVIRYASGFDTNTLGANLTYGIPLSEFVALRVGLGIQDIAVQTYPTATSDQILRFVVDSGTQFFTYEARTGITYDTRNRTFFATRGALHALSADIALPGGDLQYYNVSYRGQQYIPLPFKFTIELNASVGLVDAYGASNVVPPFENYFAGGPRTVHGYREGSLGPRDTPFNNPYGGKLRTTAQNNLIIPLPMESDGKSTRMTAFWDIGNVFAEPQYFATRDLRQSAGIAFAWFTPFLGLLDLSYSYALNPQLGDRKDRFQINFGSGF